jgi:hypothetical protein
MKNIDEFLEPYLAKLPMEGVISDIEAAKRSSEFLNASAHLTAYKLELMNNEIESSSVEDAAFASAINEQEGGDAKKREANAKANPLYMGAKKDHALKKAQVRTIDSYINIFTNAHIFYRRLVKEYTE